MLCTTDRYEASRGLFATAEILIGERYCLTFALCRRKYIQL